MPENPVIPPQWPDEDPELERAIGRLVIAWARLERELDEAARDLLRTNWDLAASFTINLGTKAKLESIQSAAHCLADVLGDEIVKNTDQIVNQTLSASADYRLFFAHSQPYALASEDGYIWMWGKLSARKGGIKGRLTRLTPKYFDKGCTRTKEIVVEWARIRRLWKPLLDELDQAERQEERE